MRARGTDPSLIIISILLVVALVAVIGILWHGNASADVFDTSLVGQPTMTLSRTVYLDGPAGHKELYSRIGSELPIKISGPMQPDGEVTSFKVTKDGQHAVYTADALTDGKVELFAVPTAGGAIVKLSAPMQLFMNVYQYVIADDGSRVAYSADSRLDQMYELYTVPITGGASTRISHTLPADHDVESFLFSPDGQRVVYRAGRTAIGKWELYSVLSTGGTAVRISQAWSATSYISVKETTGFTITCDSRTVYYLADTFGDGSPDELYSVSILGGTITPHPEHQLPTFTCNSPPSSQCRDVGATCVGYAECCSLTCSVGTCIANPGTSPPPTPTTCTDECTAGGTQCASATSVRTCGNYDSDSCLEWGTSSCSAGTLCQGGACVGNQVYCNQQPRAQCSTDAIAGATRIDAYCAACTISPCPPPGSPTPKCYQCPVGQEPTYNTTTHTTGCTGNTVHGASAQVSATASFTTETATCTIPSGSSYCTATLRWTSSGTGYIQLWRGSEERVMCIPTGGIVTKYIPMTPGQREYHLYATATCTSTPDTPLDTITVRAS